MRTLIPSAVLPMAVSGLGAASTACYESQTIKSAASMPCLSIRKAVSLP